ncbi:MAG: hypothetical protein GX995_04750 [Clostridiales bacterium]|nr:hypothetical protein [Clostridiales bacterium]
MMGEDKIKQFRNIKYKAFLVLVIFEIIIVLLSLHAIISELSNHKAKFDSVMVAPGLATLIAGIKMFNLFYLIIGLLAILPGIFFYQYFIGSKSIYTMLRLPGRYSRAKFYLYQVKFSIRGIIELWFVQLLLLLIMYLLYTVVIPRESIPDNHWKSMWEMIYISGLFPFTKPKTFIPLVFMGILLSNISILIVLIERSRIRSILAVLGLIISVIGVYSYNAHAVHSLWILPVATILSVAISVFYIYRVEIV